MAQQTIISTEYGDTSLTKINANFTDLYTTKKSDSMTTNKLLGRNTSGTGTIEEITLGTNLSMTGQTLNASGGSGITIGSTGISSGVSGRILYDNAGVVGELATNGTGNVSLTTSPTLVTPILGVATATSINGATITSGTLNGSVTGTNTGDETTARINTLYGTTNAITVGSVEVGNATDTTIARVSPGIISVEGVTVPTISSTSTLTNKTLTSPIITYSINAQNGTTYTLVLTDQSKLVTLTNAAAITLTIPTNASVAFPVGTQIDISQDGAGKVTVAGAGVTINSFGTNKSLAGQYVGATIIKTATDTWNLYGNLIA